MPPTVLITGTSSGVGLAAVEAVARRGARVVATTRSEEDAEMVEARQDALGFPVSTALLDVTDADQAAEMIDRHRPDVLVNNAGAAVLGAAFDVDDVEAADQLELLTIAPVRLARLAAETMRARGDGRIVNVSSVLAALPLPLTGWYSAAKSAMASLSETLRVELETDGITVVLVELGAVDTPAWKDAAEQMRDGDRVEQRWGRLTGAVRPLFADVSVAGAAIAEAACDERPRSRYRAGFGAHALAWAGHAPAVLRDPILRLALY